MKKILFITLIFCVISKMGSAQNEQKYVSAMHKVDSFLNRYLQYSTFAKVGDNQINDYVIEKYKKMFSPNISIIDENCPAYYDGDYRHPYDLKGRPINVICNYAKNTFAEGLSVKLFNANIDYSNLISNQVNVVLNKQVKGKTITGLRIINNDTIELQITFSTDFEKMQITETKLIGHTISFVNDIDGDFVRDEIDKCKLKRGFKNPDGCPTSDEKQEADILAMELKKKEKENKINDQVFENSIRNDKSEAEQAAEKARLEQIAQIKDIHEKEVAARLEAKRRAYKALPQQPQWHFGVDLFAGSPRVQSYTFVNNFSNVYDQSESFSKNKNSKPIFSNITSVGLQANIEYYIRKQAHWGVGISFQYQITKGDITKSDFDVSYKALDNWGNSYKRHIFTTSENSLKENFTLNQLSTPLLLKYKTNFSKKIGIQLESGVNFILSVNAESKLDDNNKFDYEATYHYGNPEPKNYFSVIDENNTDWVISQKQASRSGVSNPSDYFNNLQKEGFDIGLGQRPSNIKAKSSFTSTMGFVFHPSITYKDNDNIILNLGLMIMTQKFDNKNDISKYYLTNNVGEYNTIMNGINNFKTNYTAITLGIKYAIQPKAQPK